MAKEKYLQWRADESDRALAKRLADDYGVNVSVLFRFALNYIDANRPPLTITINPQKRSKAAARNGENKTAG